MAEEFESLHQYRQYCYAIYRALGKRTDPNPSYKATTKLPGFFRNKGHLAEQELLGLNRKITRKELDSWLVKMGSFHWTKQKPTEFSGEYFVPAKVLGYLESQYTNKKHAGNGYVNCECPACGGSKFWFGTENGDYGCWNGCSRKDILSAIGEDFGIGIDTASFNLKKEKSINYDLWAPH